MATLFSMIAHGLGEILYFLYNILWFNYGLAIVVLTVIIRFLLLPFAIKQFKSTLQMNELQPFIREIQRKYKNDKETMNKELTRLYQEKKINPFGGCLPVLINFFILYSLFLVMTSPITYMFNTPTITYTSTFAKYVTQGNYYKEVQFLEKLQKNPEIFTKLKQEWNKNYTDKTPILTAEEKNITSMNLYFLGINMGDIPKVIPPKDQIIKYLILWMIPILAFVTTYLTIKHGQLPTSNTSEMTEMQQTMQKQMVIMMPMMTLFFAFTVPVALGVYWILGNILQLIQQKALINIYVTKKEAI